MGLKHICLVMYLYGSEEFRHQWVRDLVFSVILIIADLIYELICSQRQVCGTANEFWKKILA